MTVPGGAGLPEGTSRLGRRGVKCTSRLGRKGAKKETEGKEQKENPKSESGVLADILCNQLCVLGRSRN